MCLCLCCVCVYTCVCVCMCVWCVVVVGALKGSWSVTRAHHHHDHASVTRGGPRGKRQWSTNNHQHTREKTTQYTNNQHIYTQHSNNINDIKEQPDSGPIRAQYI